MSAQTSAPVAVCISCGQIIVWAVTENGKSMPVERCEGGNVVLLPPGDPRVGPIAYVLKKGERGVKSLQDRYVSHFATCPFAARHRKPRAAKP